MKNAQKTLLALALFGCLSLVSCNDEASSSSIDQRTCQHSFSLKSSKDATCEKDGIKVFECSICGYDKTETVPALGHSFGEWFTESEPTCLKSEVLARTCQRTNCTAKETKEGKPALGHKWGEWVTEGDTMKRYCEREGCDAYEEQAAPMLRLFINQEEVSPFVSSIDSYLKATNPDVKDYVRTDDGYQGYKVRWLCTFDNIESLRVDYSEQSDFATYQSESVDPSKSSCSLWNLKKASTYYVRLVGKVGEEEKTSEVATLKTASYGPRVMKIDGIHNVRDVGGYQTPSGRTVQGKMFRGGALSPSTDKAYTNINLSDQGKKYMSETLGIKTDFDLRSQAENRAPDTPIESGLTVSPIPNASLHYYSVGGYDDGIANKNGYRKVFSDLSDPSNYPVYIHCTGGADRTGTVSFLVNALLGVSKEDLIHDYEYTSFSIYGERNSRGGVYRFPELLEAIEAYEGDSLSKKVESYLLSCGVTADEIYNLKAIMLGKPTKATIRAQASFDLFTDSKYEITVSDDFCEVSSLTMNGIAVPFSVEGKTITVLKEDFPSSLQKGKVTGSLIVDGLSYEFSFVLSGSHSLSAFDFTNGSITLNTSSSKAVGNVVGYDGKVAKVHIEEKTSKSQGGTYVFIGSYGFYIRGDTARVAERNGDVFKETTPRNNAFTVYQASLAKGLTLGLSASVLNETTMHLEMYDGAVLLGSYDFTRVSDEIDAENARFEIMISGDVTEEILSSPIRS